MNSPTRFTDPSGYSDYPAISLGFPSGEGFVIPGIFDAGNITNPIIPGLVDPDRQQYPDIPTGTTFVFGSDNDREQRGYPATDSPAPPFRIPIPRAPRVLGVNSTPSAYRGREENACTPPPPLDQQAREIGNDILESFGQVHVGLISIVALTGLMAVPDAGPGAAATVFVLIAGTEAVGYYFTETKSGRRIYHKWFDPRKILDPTKGQKPIVVCVDGGRLIR